MGEDPGDYGGFFNGGDELQGAATIRATNDMLAGKQSVERSALLREAVRLIVEEALEAEVSDELAGFNTASLGRAETRGA